MTSSLNALVQINQCSNLCKNVFVDLKTQKPFRFWFVFLVWIFDFVLYKVNYKNVFRFWILLFWFAFSKFGFVWFVFLVKKGKFPMKKCFSIKLLKFEIAQKRIKSPS